MTTEVRAQGVACPLSCDYCYQNPMRDAGNIKTQYEIYQLLEKIKGAKERFSLFGGEPLLMPKQDLEILFDYGFETYKENALQTNGMLIDDEHIAMFKKYNVSVGVSIDGPDELNDLRFYKNKAETRKATATTISNIEKMANEGINLSVIFTLHRLNGTKERLPRLIEFMEYLSDIGVSNGNIHMLEVDSELMKERYMLTQEENAEAFLALADFFNENNHMNYHPFTDMEDMMRFDDTRALCWLKFCDPLSTRSVQGLEGDGTLSNCSRTNKEGVDFFKADGHGMHRYISLLNTPEEFGGCQGCRFFVMCGGSCPGEGIDGDWRNKTIHCHTMKSLYTYYEEKLDSSGVTPLTKREDFDRIESIIINGLYADQVIHFEQVKQIMEREDQEFLEMTFAPRVVPVYGEGEEHGTT